MSESEKTGQFKLAVQAYDFAPDLLTLQHSPPSRLPRFLVVGIGAMVLALLAWACVAELDIVTTAQGRLVPLSYVKVVQPAETGVVSEILVKDGDIVKAGQVLIRLDAQLSRSDLQAQARDVDIKRLTLRRIENELANVDSGVVNAANLTLPTGAGAALVVSQVQTQYQAKRQAFQDAMAQELTNLEKAKGEHASAEQIYNKLKQTVPIYEQASKAYEKLVDGGFVSEIAVNEKRREWVEKSHDLGAQASTLISLQANIDQSKKRMASIRSNYLSQLETERIEIQTQLAKSVQDLEKSTIRADLLEVKAPTDGVVKDLTVTSKNAVVQAGALLMNIVPRGEQLQAEVTLSNEDVGFLAVGHKAQLKIAAYPFTKYGLLQGLVTYVGADSSDPKQSNYPQTAAFTYRALVQLERQSLAGLEGTQSLALSSGMAVIAEIQQGKRSVAEYLFSPVLKLRAEAARER